MTKPPAPRTRGAVLLDKPEPKAKTLASVLVAVTHGGSEGKVRHFQSVYAMTAAHGSLNWATRQGPLLVQQRNQLVESFLAEDDLEWLFCLDDDLTFDPDALVHLLQAADPDERPIMCGFYCSWNSATREIQPVAYLARGGLWAPIQQWPAGKVIPVDAAGAGAMLIHRSVLEAMRDADYGPEFPWFAFELDGNFGGAGEDMTFCRRAKELGFPVHVHTGVTFGHLKEIEVTVGDFIRQSLGDAESSTQE